MSTGGLSSLYRRAGKSGEAAEFLRSAAAMCHDMGMTYWTERAEAELTRSAEDVDHVHDFP